MWAVSWCLMLESEPEQGPVCPCVRVSVCLCTSVSIPRQSVRTGPAVWELTTIWSSRGGNLQQISGANTKLNSGVSWRSDNEAQCRSVCRRPLVPLLPLSGAPAAPPPLPRPALWGRATLRPPDTFPSRWRGEREETDTDRVQQAGPGPVRHQAGLWDPGIRDQGEGDLWGDRGEDLSGQSLSQLSI